MQAKWVYILIFLGSAFISSASQIVLKKSADKEYSSKIREYLNAPVIIAYGLFFFATLLTIFAYRGVSLSLGAILEASGYVWVALLGRIFLGERISKRKLCGLGLIILGIVVFNLKI